jgi:seryl-tRNA synthetase
MEKTQQVSSEYTNSQKSRCLASPSRQILGRARIIRATEEIMQELGFHYQVVNICDADLGAPAAKKYDIEV